MRTEQEVMDLVLDVAKADERIRAVLLVGSRANPEVLKDIYQDYDITYFVEDLDVIIFKSRKDNQNINKCVHSIIGIDLKRTKKTSWASGYEKTKVQVFTLQFARSLKSAVYRTSSSLATTT